MKKFCCVACVVFLMLVVCIPCFAESTTSSEPIDWFGSSSVVAYRFDYTDWYQLPSSSTPVTIYGDQTFKNKSLHDGDIVYFYYATGVDPYYRININGTNSNISSGSTAPSISGSLTVLESSYTSTGGSYTPAPTPTPVYSGSPGLIDSGVNASISYLGSVLTYIWTTPAIMTCIGLAVGVVLIGWGISKVKDLVVGY